MIITQNFALLIMGWEASYQNFYATIMPFHIILRYLLMLVTYYMFCKDYKSISQSLLLFKQFPEIRDDSVLNFSFRIVNVFMNELVVFWIIVSSDLGDIGGLGLIINFSSAMLICQLFCLILPECTIFWKNSMELQTQKMIFTLAV